ncbi:MAG: hypothetical protein COY39_01130 [Alphaproteobacteria bacterium CG_4_10_14_0_8_um_filter_37_21]|nr:MAG: hypothetical protein COY39_01130 [Alphaproteobacteria bacterium CG_4_10_14_0_8_um_filter_37_21]
MNQIFQTIFFINCLCTTLLSHNLHQQQWCHAYVEEAEKKFSIPKNTLKAIALTESGQYFKGKGIVAWPWSINVQGKGYIFPTKEKAVQAAHFLVSSGHTNFDMGCMQINYRHHGSAFKSLHDAFSPQQNVEYGGQFLRSLFDKNKSWKIAQAHYHSGNPEFYIPYLKLVESHFQKLNDVDTYTMPLNIENLMHAQSELKTRFQQSENIRHLPLGKTVQSIVGAGSGYGSVTKGGHKIISKNFSKLNQLQSVYAGHIVSQTPQTRPIKTKGFRHINTLTVASRRYTPQSIPYFDKNRGAHSTETVKMQSGVVKIMRYK